MPATGVLGNMLERGLQEALSYGIGSALGPTLAPLTQGVLNRVWPLDPNIPVSAELAAHLAHTGRMEPDTALEWASKSGVGHDHFAALEQGLIVPVGLGELLALSNRQLVTDQELRQALHRLQIEPGLHEQIVRLREQLLSAPDLAMARQQGFIDAAEARQRSALVGVDPAQADLMFELAGLPPGIGEGLTLLRRGLIDEARFAQIVREGHTKTKYTADLLELRYTPLSAAVAAEALIRERISEADAVKIAEMNGLRRDDFLTWSRMLGRPIAVGEALTLVNRGKMTHEQFREAVARSDIRTEYTDQLLELRVKYPTLFQVGRALTAGTIDETIARHTLTIEGYAPEWVDAIVKAGGQQKKTKEKDLTLSVLETLYDAGLEDEHDILEKIVALGYTEAEAQDLLLLHDARRYVSELVRAVNAIRLRYVQHVIDDREAHRLLDVLNLKPTTRDRVFSLWQTERDATVRALTPAQVGLALKYDIFTVDQARARWQKQGYSADDSLILAEIVLKGPIHATTAALAGAG